MSLRSDRCARVACNPSPSRKPSPRRAPRPASRRCRPPHIHSYHHPYLAPLKSLTVRHETPYRYSRPVSFGPHRLMLRPRDSHELRLVDAELTLSPPGALRWMHDVFGNSVAQVEFAQAASEAADRQHAGDRTLRADAAGISDRARCADLSLRLFVQRPQRPRPPGRPSLSRSERRGRRLGEALCDATLHVDLQSAVEHERRDQKRIRLHRRYEEGTQTPTETLEERAAPAVTSRCCSSRRCAVSASAPVSSLAICTIRRSTARRRCKAPARPMPGRMSICRAPAGSR